MKWLSLMACCLVGFGWAQDSKDPNRGDRDNGALFGSNRGAGASYEASSVAFNWVDISAVDGAPMSFALGDDAGTGPLALGFSFDFFSGTFTDVDIASNGYLTFGADNSDFSNDCPLDSNTPPWLIGVHWDDLDPFDEGDLVWYETFGPGACPYVPPGVSGTPACAIAMYVDYDFFPGSPTASPGAGTFEAILYSSGEVLFQYLEVFDTGSATIGIAESEFDFVLWSCNQAGAVTNGSAVLFAPPVLSEIPTLGEYGLIAFLVLMAGVAVVMMRRQRRANA